MWSFHFFWFLKSDSELKSNSIKQGIGQVNLQELDILSKSKFIKSTNIKSVATPNIF